MQLFHKILCPVAFSDNAMAALDHAATIARKDDALLYMMHVEFIPIGDPTKLDPYAKVSTQPDKLRLEQIARKHLAKVRHQILVEVGWPAEVIEKAAEKLDVDLIVMATHERSGIDRLFIGSIAEHVLRSSKRPVLTFGPSTSIGALKKILCLVDFDPDSIAALNYGSRLAQRYNAAVSLLRVVPTPFEPSEQSVEPLTPEWEQDARARLVKVAAEVLGAETRCELIVRRGDAASAILEVEKELQPDLIVMASHEQSGLGHLIFGSAAERTVRESNVPVLTVRGQHRAA